MRLFLLDAQTPLPPPEVAFNEPNGLLAATHDISPARLEAAYANGIFPWYSEGQPVLWWSPDPRMVLHVNDFSPGHALRKTLRRIARGGSGVQVRVDTAFDAVMAACAAPRPGQDGTWISHELRQAYSAWHRAGRVHSVETWMDGELAGGLYGVSLGSMFFGESMFTRVTDASKIALAHLVAFLTRQGVTLIDCQQETAHLASLGARPVARAVFLEHVRDAVTRAGPDWRRGELLADGTLISLP